MNKETKERYARSRSCSATQKPVEHGPRKTDHHVHTALQALFPSAYPHAQCLQLDGAVLARCEASKSLAFQLIQEAYEYLSDPEQLGAAGFRARLLGTGCCWGGPLSKELRKETDCMKAACSKYGLKLHRKQGCDVLTRSRYVESDMAICLGLLS